MRPPPPGLGAAPGRLLGLEGGLVLYAVGAPGARGEAGLNVSGRDGKLRRQGLRSWDW